MRNLVKKEFKPFCEDCMQEMTHWSKDKRLVYCTNCWVAVPVPLDTVPNHVRLSELKRLKEMVESSEEEEPGYKPYQPPRTKRRRRG